MVAVAAGPLETVAAVAGGLSFAFLLLATAASGLLECVAAALGWRARYLRRATDVLLGAAPALCGGGLRGWARLHLGREGSEPPAATDPAHARFVAAVRAAPALRGSLGSAPEHVSPAGFAAAVLAALGPAADAAALRAAARALPPAPGHTLAALLAGETTLPGCRAAIAGWYADAMGEASAAYRRNAARCLLAIAAALVAGFDVDSFGLARALAGGALPFGWPGGPSLAPLPGWALSVLAVSLGGPFWFDLLRSVASLRGAGGER